MQTYSHFLLTLTLSKPLGKWLDGTTTVPAFRKFGFVFGSILPDTPLILTTIVCMLVDSVSDADATTHLFKEWYFENPWVKAEHNIFHSPITLGLMLFASFCAWKRGVERVSWAYWCLLGCCLHTTCDIPVHHDDGPLILFPINWNYRFESPISYYDPDFYGREFATVEHVADLIMIVWQCWLCYTGDKNTTKPDLELSSLVNAEGEVV